MSPYSAFSEKARKCRRTNRDLRACANAIAVIRDLGLHEDIVNVDGNSIAHGHPIGATGAIQTTRLLHSMRRDGIERGVVTMCIGGGQGIALCLEALK